MVQLTNSGWRYGAVAVGLHWIMALLLGALIVLGLYMDSLPDVGFDTLKIRLVLFHKELGVLAFLLAGLRLAWRVGNVLPQLVQSLPEWQQVAARFIHLCFYGLMLALPLTGWLMSSAAGIPVSLLGWFMLPDLIQRSDRLFQTFIGIHKWLGYGLMLCMLAHIGAALRHHWLLRDDTLRKMLPGADQPRGLRG